MVEVICDTSFLIHLATARVRNIDRLDEEIGQTTFVVPRVVRAELAELARNPAKDQGRIRAAIRYAENLRTVPIGGRFADRELLEYVSRRRATVATMDRALKRRIKGLGGSVVSFSNDRIVLES